MKLVITCEHGGNQIPSAYTFIFKNQQELLNSHRAWDLGILDAFNFVKEDADFSKSSSISRLLIEKNRSLHHPNLFSPITKTLAFSVKQEIIEMHYLPYRKEVEEKIKNFLDDGDEVLHLSLHSFTPIWKDKKRTTEIGLLYDPKRTIEKFWVNKLKNSWKTLSSLKIRMNYPYLGTADGFTTHLRKQFPKNYSGIEIELNQGLLEEGHFPLRVKQNLRNMIQRL
ncbi:N-formylglutamate amidohydrolase [Mesonia sp. MT50]|uniref:N-formylglutamate amidohydrolase n=1 Tax=Mesonia profundi TaxID=3070998 RepID=A0ABU1A4S9_9FLAO|nr:N-formylglutamate amidohydrolase [Mesonia profundi]MDQ7917889.1 N-formylglutamate amidohydrolase [Mesonia profundi]